MIYFLLVVTLLQACLGSREHTLIELAWATHPDYGDYNHCRITMGPLFEPSWIQIEGDFYQSGRAKITLTDHETMEPLNMLFILCLYFPDRGETPSYRGLFFLIEDCTHHANFRHCQATLERTD